MSNATAKGYNQLIRREEKLRIQAGQVMKELQVAGGDWQFAWRNHPVAHAYRQLLKDAWAREEQ